MKNALIYTVIFAALQVMVSFIVNGVWTLIGGEASVKTLPCMITTMASFSVIVIAVFLWTKWSEVSRNWILTTRPWYVLTWCAVAACGAVVPSSWLQEQMPELPDFMNEEMSMILSNRWGYLIVGLLAPLAEELVFRGAVLRSLLRWNSHHWVGIVISALLFSLIHMNPAQMPHAFLIGILLGWMYYRTDSIVPGVVYHWANNTIAYVMFNLYPIPDMKLLDLFGTERGVWMALGSSMLILLPALFQLNLFLKKK